MTIATFIVTPQEWIHQAVRVSGFRRLIPEFDGENLYLSQWYEQRILKMDSKGNVAGTIDIGAEICGHVLRTARFNVLPRDGKRAEAAIRGGKPDPGAIRVELRKAKNSGGFRGSIREIGRRGYGYCQSSVRGAFVNV